MVLKKGPDRRGELQRLSCRSDFEQPVRTVARRTTKRIERAVRKEQTGDSVGFDLPEQSQGIRPVLLGNRDEGSTIAQSGKRLLEGNVETDGGKLQRNVGIASRRRYGRLPIQ